MKLDKTGYYPENHTSEAPELREVINVNDSAQQEEKPEIISEKDAKPIGVEIANGFSKFLSWILVPLLMPVYGTVLIFSLSYMNQLPGDSKLMTTIVVALLNAVLPGLLFLLLKKMGIIHDIGLNSRSERTIPYIICILCIAATSAYSWWKGAPMWMVMFFAGGAINGVLELLINLKWKISVHSAGVAGIVALITHIWLSYGVVSSVFVWLMVWILLAGLLGSARIWLGRHTIGQVFCGYLLGFCSVYFIMLIN